MSNTIASNVYTRNLKATAEDLGVFAARPTVVLDQDLKPKEISIPGPKCRVRLDSSRQFRVDPQSKEIEVATHQNNPSSHRWQRLTPIFGLDETGQEILKAVLDEQGGKVRFQLLADGLFG